MKHFKLDSVRLRQAGSKTDRSFRGMLGDLQVPHLWVTPGLWLASQDGQHEGKHVDYEPATGQQAQALSV